MKQTTKVRFSKVKNAITAVLASITVLVAVTVSPVFAAPAVTITSPTSNVTVNNGSIEVKGTAPANKWVRLYIDGTQKTAVQANGSGQWGTTLTNIATGAHALKAVNAESGLSYFATAGSPSQLHSIDPQTGAIDTRPGFPINVAGLTPIAMPSPTGRYIYVGGFVFEAGNLQRVDLDTGVAQQVSGYPSSANAEVGAYSSDGTKYYSPNADGTITVIDVDSNTILQTITTGATTHNSIVNIGGILYASDSNTGQIYIVNPADNSFTSFAPACPSGGKASAILPDPDNVNTLWVSCSNKTLISIDKSTHAVIVTASLPDYLAGISKIPHSNKVVAASPTSPEVYIVDATSGALLQTITMPATGFAPIATSDGSRVLLATPGGSFSGTDAVIINTADYSVTNLTLPGPTLGMFPGPDTIAEASITFTVGAGLADTGISQMYLFIVAAALVVVSSRRLLSQTRN